MSLCEEVVPGFIDLRCTKDGRVKGREKKSSDLK